MNILDKFFNRDKSSKNDKENYENKIKEYENKIKEYEEKLKDFNENFMEWYEKENQKEIQEKPIELETPTKTIKEILKEN